MLMLYIMVITLVKYAQVIDQFSGSARAVVFVVDSNTVSKQVRDVAEYLHFLLTNKNINSNRCEQRLAWGLII